MRRTTCLAIIAMGLALLLPGAAGAAVLELSGNEWLSDTRLSRLTAGTVEAYKAARLAAGAGPSPTAQRINYRASGR